MEVIYGFVCIFVGVLFGWYLKDKQEAMEKGK